MAAKKNLCAQIDIDLHRKITEAKEQAGLTTAEYITNLLLEYYEMKEKSCSCLGRPPLALPRWKSPRSSVPPSPV